MAVHQRYNGGTPTAGTWDDWETPLAQPRLLPPLIALLPPPCGTGDPIWGENKCTRRHIKVVIFTLGLLLMAAGSALAQSDAGLAGKINTGYDLLEQGKFDQAQKIYEEILQKQPDHPIALNNLAAISCKQGKFDQALAQLQRALPRAAGYKITLNRVCNVDGVCAAFRQSTDNFGRENLEDLIKSNILMVQMAAANQGSGEINGGLKSPFEKGGFRQACPAGNLHGSEGRDISGHHLS